MLFATEEFDRRPGRRVFPFVTDAAATTDARQPLARPNDSLGGNGAPLGVPTWRAFNAAAAARADIPANSERNRL